MEQVRWSVGAAQASGVLAGGVLVLRLTGILTLTTLRLLRIRIRALWGMSAMLLDLRDVYVPLAEDTLRQFAGEGPVRQPTALLARPEQEALFSVYCWEICPPHKKLRVLFIDDEEGALAWAFRRAQCFPPLAPLLIADVPALVTQL